MAEILMIDPFEFVRELISLELAEAGHWIDAVDTMAQAQRLTASRSYDVILIDPYGHTQEARTLLHDVKSFLPHVPIIAFSAHTFPGSAEWLATTQEFIIKSSDLTVLKDAIERCTSKEKLIQLGGRRDNS